MTKEEVRALYDKLDEAQKKEVQKIFEEKRTELFKWYDVETEKVYEKLKEEGRYRLGLDANNSQPEARALSAEYNHRFCALPEESICEFLGIDAG
ncbi:hypothetical protein AALC75_02075 [Lachnospiraceae bacterium 48-42]|nr:hypothetical protein [Dorea sp.]